MHSPSEQATARLDAAIALAQQPRVMRWLDRKAQERGHTRAQVARELGVTYGYLQQLDVGIRPMYDTSLDFTRACARYLDVPALAVMLASGRLSIMDCAFPQQPQPRADAGHTGLNAVAEDQLVGPLLPPEAWDGPQEAADLLVQLYEQAVRTGEPRSLPMALQGLQDAAIALVDVEVAEEELRMLRPEVH